MCDGLRAAGLVLALALVPSPAGGYETDQFTNRQLTIADSTAVLDEQVNLAIGEVIKNWQGPRNDMRVVDGIYRRIGGRHWVDKIERWAMKSDQVERLPTPRYDSIYHGHPIWATRVAGLFGVGPTLRINQQLVGSDKLGHFLSQGRKYYRRYLRYQDEAQAGEHSAYTERAIFGQSTTGVYSNADLVANYEGYLFYRSLFEDDVVAGKPSILRWEDERWVVQRAFTWADHVNAYWDEALNIPHYDRLLYPHMEERLKDYCGQYRENPDLWQIENEQPLKEKYAHIQLRETSELRLGSLCSESTDEASLSSSSGSALPVE